MTPKDYVMAIILYLNERGDGCVCFDAYSYGDVNDIPFCRTLNERIDSVSTVPDQEKVCIMTVSRKERTFDGSEEEDFEKLFYETYYYICDPYAPEAEEWLAEKGFHD